MSQPPDVLVAVGKSQRGSIPQQTYENLFTEFNMGGAASFANDADFYNTKIRIPSTQGKSDFDIYGFMPGNCKYTYDYSIQHIVNFFQQDERISIVVCDQLDIYPSFTFHQYIHPQAPTNNIPFFIRRSLVNQIQFVNEELMLQIQLNKLKQQEIIFHIAEPLISMVHNVSKGNE